MKALEIWNDVKERLAKQGHGDTRYTASTFAGGMRAVAVELLTHARDVLSDEDAARLHNRFMAAAERVEKLR